MLGTVNLVNNPWLGSLQALFFCSLCKVSTALTVSFSPFSLPLNYCNVRMPLETFLCSVDSGKHRNSELVKEQGLSMDGVLHHNGTSPSHLFLWGQGGPQYNSIFWN